MYINRKKLYRKYEKLIGTKVITYVTGDRGGMETQIGPDAFDFFADQLDAIGIVPKISMFLYTCGGSTLAAWSIINLMRLFTDNLEIIVPSKCRSAGTLMCLGANSIVMTKQATLGPIDPSCAGPLNPQIPGMPPYAKTPVSVEAINGFINLVRDECGIKDSTPLSSILLNLSTHVHPMVLGEIFRAKKQIRMLASKLLSNQPSLSQDKKNEIINFLCCESGSHDYTINRREALDMGLSIRKPDNDEYDIIKSIYMDFSEELDLKNPFMVPSFIEGVSKKFTNKRALIESLVGGCDVFLTEGTFVTSPPPNVAQTPSNIPANVTVQIISEGWRHLKDDRHGAQ